MGGAATTKWDPIGFDPQPNERPFFAQATGGWTAVQLWLCSVASALERVSPRKGGWKQIVKGPRCHSKWHLPRTRDCEILRLTGKAR